MRIMKLLLIGLVFLASVSLSFAVPEIAYTNFARTTGGGLVLESTVDVRITIFNSGSKVFQEVFTAVPTNGYGLFTVKLGTGTPVSPYFPNAYDDLVAVNTLNVQAETNDGGGYRFVQLSPLLNTALKNEEAAGIVTLNDAYLNGDSIAVLPGAPITLTGTGLIQSDATIAAINTNGNKTLTTKGYVDAADALISANPFLVWEPAGADLPNAKVLNGEANVINFNATTATLSILNNGISEPKLKMANDPVNGYIIKWNGSDMTWVDPTVFTAAPVSGDGTAGNPITLDYNWPMFLNGINLDLEYDATLKVDPTNGLGIDLAHANSWTANQTFSSVDINGGTIDATVIGATTPAEGTFTTLVVNSTADIGTDLTVGGYATIGDYLVVAGNTTTNTLDVIVDATVGGNLDVTGTTTSALFVGKTNFDIQDGAGIVDFTFNNLGNAVVAVDYDATLKIDGSDKLGLDLAHPNHWTGLQEFDAVDINGGTIDGTVIGGDVPAFGRFTILDVNFHANIGTNLIVGDDASIGNNLTVGGLTTTNSLDVTTTANVGTNLTVGGLTTTNSLDVTTTANVGTNLTVGGLTTTNSLDVTTDAFVGNDLAVVNDLGVGNDAKIGNNLEVIGNTTTNTLDVTTTANVGTNLTVGGLTTTNTLDVTTDAVVGNDLAVVNDLGVGNDASVGGNLVVTGTTTSLLFIGETNFDIQDGAGIADFTFNNLGDAVVSVDYDATLKIDGTDKLGLDLAHSNEWTALQTFRDLTSSNDIATPIVDIYGAVSITGEAGNADFLTFENVDFLLDGDAVIAGATYFMDNVSIDLNLDVTGDVTANTYTGELVNKLEDGAGIADFTYNNLGAAIVAVDYDATLNIDGTDKLGIDLAHSNTWTADQLLNATAAQGNNLIAAINLGTANTLFGDVVKHDNTLKVTASNELALNENAPFNFTNIIAFNPTAGPAATFTSTDATAPTVTIENTDPSGVALELVGSSEETTALEITTGGLNIGAGQFIVSSNSGVTGTEPNGPSITVNNNGDGVSENGGALEILVGHTTFSYGNFSGYALNAGIDLSAQPYTVLDVQSNGTNAVTLPDGDMAATKNGTIIYVINNGAGTLTLPGTLGNVNTGTSAQLVYTAAGWFRLN